MTASDETADDPPPFRRAPVPVPGLVLVWSGGAPAYRAFPLATRAARIGRDASCEVAISGDSAVSRQHAEVSFDAATNELIVRDDASNNGTFFNAARVTGSLRSQLPPALSASSAPRASSTRDAAPPRVDVLRTGGSIFLITSDVTPFAADSKDRSTLIEGDSVIGPSMHRLRASIREAAKSNLPRLIQGETGSGKERIARLFHSSGPRSHAAFVPINCAELVRDRASADLFGAARGSYTGADRHRTGAFQEADCGVLFLDEIAELPLDVQATLLRVLDDGWIRPLGGERVRVDVAVVTASHANLKARVAAGKFRQDLRERLRRRQVRVPPLRERLEEIPFLVELIRASLPNAPPPSARFIEACLLHDWPGNVRALETVVYGSAAASIAHEDPLLELDENALFESDESADQRAPNEPDPPEPEPRPARVQTPREMQDEMVAKTVKRHGGKVPMAATELGISATAVYDALKRHRARERGD